MQKKPGILLIPKVLNQKCISWGWNKEQSGCRL